MLSLSGLGSNFGAIANFSFSFSVTQISRKEAKDKKHSVKYIRSRRKAGKSTSPSLHVEGKPIMEDAEKVEVFNAFFSFTFIYLFQFSIKKVNYQMTDPSSSKDRGGEDNEPRVVKEYLDKLDVLTSEGLDETWKIG